MLFESLMCWSMTSDVRVAWLQLKEDTIALAAGAVTAMLAANAAAAGPMDSPERVCQPACWSQMSDVSVGLALTS